MENKRSCSQTKCIAQPSYSELFYYNSGFRKNKAPGRYPHPLHGHWAVGDAGPQS